MRVVFASMPLPGHFFPLVPLARACAGAGHEVTVATGPALAPRVAELGFAHVPVSATTEWAVGVARERYADLIERPEPRTDFISAFFSSLIAPAVAAELIPWLEAEQPDLVVHEFYDVGAAAAAGAAGVPSVCHGVNRLPPPQMLDDMGSRLAEVWTAHGVPAPEPLAGLFGLAYLDVCPPSMQDGDSLFLAPAVRPVRPAPWSPDDPLPPHLESPRVRPRVYVTLGTVVNTGERAARVFGAVVGGLADLPVEAVVTVGADGDPAALEPLPANVTVERFLPQARLLAQVDAVVHHCGAGTMFGAAAAGLPQLGLPQSTDQFISGAPALAASGAGLVLGPEETTPERVATSLERLLAGADVRARVGGLAAEIARMPEAPSSVRLLETLAAA